MQRAFRLLVLFAVGAAVAAMVRAMRRENDPLPSPAGSAGEPWPPLRPEPVPAPQASESETAPAPAPTAPEPGATPTPAAAFVAPVDGECPDGYPIKAKMSSKIFHSPGQLNYDRTTPDRCYRDAAAAEADGLRAAKR